MSRALDWMIRGRLASAEEAKQADLVTDVLSPGGLIPEANWLAKEISEQTSAPAVAATRGLMWKCLVLDTPLRATRLESRWGGSSEDSETPPKGFPLFCRQAPAFTSIADEVDLLPWDDSDRDAGDDSLGSTLRYWLYWFYRSAFNYRSKTSTPSTIAQ
jgi:hypothetical protein